MIPPSLLAARAPRRTLLRGSMNRILLVLAAALLALPILIASAAIPETPAVTKGVSFVRSKFQLDGSYGATSAGQNFDAIYAVRAAGFNPARDHTDTNDSPVTWLAAHAAAQTKPASAAKAALAAKAIGADPRAVNGIDLIARITAASSPAVTVFLLPFNDGGASLICRIAIALAVGPVNGGSPTNISYSTHANPY